VGDLTPAPARKTPLLDREKPLGIILVAPAVLYLALFIAYPFGMSVYMSFTDAQAGSQKWKVVGFDNYSKVEGYEVVVNDLVLASLPAEADAKAMVEARPSARIDVQPAGANSRASLIVAGRTIALIELPGASEAGYVANTISQDFAWSVRHKGAAFEVVARSDSSPISLGQFKDKDVAAKVRGHALLIPGEVVLRAYGTGLLQDPNFLTAVKNTFKYTFGTEIIKFIIGVPCALLLNRKFKGRRILRGLVVFPWVIPIAISANAWLWILDSTYSVINWVLVKWHVLSPANIINFRGDKDYAMLSVIAVNVWRGFPFTTIIILAGLTSIPDEILERAKLDGANSVQRFFYIIAPMVRPILMVSLLFSIIFSFTDFNTIWILTKGGPYDQTQVISTYAYQVGINAGYLGKGAAISLFMFPIMATIVYAMLQFLRREN